MRKTDAVRIKEIQNTVGAWRKVIECLWIPKSGDRGEAEWRVEDEAENSAVSDFSTLQGRKAWPFPESAS